MKVFIIMAVAIVSIGVAAFLIVRNDKSLFIEEAQEAETMGKYDEAATFYARSLLSLVPIKPVDDIGQKALDEPDKWVQRILSYKEWINHDTRQEPDSYTKIIEGVAGVIKKHSPVNKISRYKIKPLTIEEYQRYWEATIIGDMDSEKKQVQETIFEQLYSDSISVIKLSSPKYYTYELHVLNRSKKRAITLTVLPDTSVHVLAQPGLHLLIIKSTVTFPSGELWVSPVSLIPMEVPEKPSLVSANVYTSVSR